MTKSKQANELVILVDTREQRPLEFETYPTEVVTLPVGDYGLKGFSDWTNPQFIVERKSLGDLIGSLTAGRERFMKECEKMRQFRFRAILVEARRIEIEQGEYRSEAKPQSILGSLSSLEVRSGIHVIFAGDRTRAAAEVERLVRTFARGIENDYRKLGAMKKEDGT